MLATPSPQERWLETTAHGETLGPDCRSYCASLGRQLHPHSRYGAPANAHPVLYKTESSSQGFVFSESIS